MADDWAGIAMLALVVGGGIYILKEHPEFLQKKDMGGGGAAAADVGAGPTTITPKKSQARPVVVPVAGGAGGGGGGGGVVSTGTGKLDPNGVTKLYPDASPPKYSNTTGGGGIEQQRMKSTGKTVPRREWEIRGPAFLNQEVTCYFNLAIKNPDTMSLKLRGGPHSGDACACNYIHYIPVNGDSHKIGGQCPHNNYKEFGASPLFSLGNVAGRWIGAKAVEWNTGGGVHMETWIDMTGTPPGKWQKWISFDHTGQGIPAMTKSPWSCPTAEILMRVDFEQGGDCQAKAISAREITPPGGGGGGAAKKSGLAEIDGYDYDYDLYYPSVDDDNYITNYDSYSYGGGGATPDYKMMFREADLVKIPQQRITVV